MAPILKKWGKVSWEDLSPIEDDLVSLAGEWYIRSSKAARYCAKNCYGVIVSSSHQEHVGLCLPFLEPEA